MPQLDHLGFVHVLCNACGNPDVWLRCETCDKADRFEMNDGVVTCQCGATYSHGSCLCGSKVPPTGSLKLVAFEDGPMALADLEVDWKRVAMLASVLAILLVGIGFWWFG